ncbi:MAG: DNA-binding transcriptional regulator Fis [Pseudomonadales bacterium]|nr:DNA-binding transcriptional regulator Fis [Pseudomonadales bacterium]
MSELDIVLEQDITPENEPVNATHSLRESVEIAMKNYFSHLEGQAVTDVYQLVMSEVEAPLMEAVMKHTRGNQTKASEVLGLNRGTLRKKLKTYGML